MIHRPAYWAPAIAVGVWAVVCGCGARTAIRTIGCPPGSLACRCHDNGTCDDGLSCVAGQCVAPADVGTGGAPTGGAPGVRNPNTGRGTGGSPIDTGPPPLSACEELESNPDECGRISVKSGTHVLLVIDKSGSMDTRAANASLSRWETLQTALAALFNSPGIITGFGLQLFPTTTVGPNVELLCEEDCCELPDDSPIDVPIGPAAETIPEIEAALRNTALAGATPTAAALARAYDYFTNGHGAALSGGRHVLLATDGGANCNPNLNCGMDLCTYDVGYSVQCVSPTGELVSCCLDREIGCFDQLETVERIQDLYAIGVLTIVVGLARSEIHADVLNAFAMAGGVESAGGPPGYFEISADGEATELIAALQPSERSLLRSCEVAIPPQVAEQPLALNTAVVAIDCEEIPLLNRYGQRNWEYQYNPQGVPTAVQLLGDVCERLQREGADRIDVFFVCTHPLL